ncbi:MAG TPA: hypothetical protein DDW98_13925 [Gammaproteobacteria bacterium]|nr:hypothetical protein [Gammaproteobacteria bacterium]HBG51847.1 hypothetical protein [Gammaproteobacteria bacterium]
MIMAYGFAAAIRPVWRLLAPRDYPVRGRLRSHLCRSCVPRRLHHHQPAVPSRAFTPWWPRVRPPSCSTAMRSSRGWAMGP